MADHRVLTLNFPDDTPVTLEFESGCDVIHCHDDYHERVFIDTGIFENLASLAVSSFFKDNLLIEQMRDEGLLDGYHRGDYNFENYVCDTLRETNWEHDFVEGVLEQYDYKRGYYRVTSKFFTSLGELKNVIRNQQYLTTGWTVNVHTGMGTLVVS